MFNIKPVKDEKKHPVLLKLQALSRSLITAKVPKKLIVKTA